MSLQSTGAIQTHHRVPGRRAGRLASAFAVATLGVAVTVLPAPAAAQFAGGRAPATFADLVEKVKPAVVSIRVSSSGTTRLSRHRDSPFNRRRGAMPFPDLPPDHPLNEFFRNLPRGGQGGPAPRQRRRRAQGSGFVISADGFVVTNHHVIKGGDDITVVFDGKTKYQADLVGVDPRTDLALLKIKSDRQFPHVRFATRKSRVGDWVVAVGNPFGLGGTVTAGIVSAQGRNIGSGPYDFIQVDAAVNRGNSGGPTFNLDGEVIGVNTAIYSPSGGNVGIAFAVPAATATEVIEQLKKSGTVSRGWLGVGIQSISEDMAASLGLKEAQGALISNVTDDSPAQKSGLRSGDAILKVNGDKIADSRDLARKIAAFSPGSTVAVAIRRADRDMTINVKLGTFPSGGKTGRVPPKIEKPKPTSLKDLGLDLVTRPGGAGVVVASVDPDSDAADKGLRRGDGIVQVNGKDVDKPGDVDKAVQAAKKLGRKAVLVTIQRDDRRLFVALQLNQSG